MPEIAIQVEGLGKRYRIGAAQERYVALRDVLSRQARSLGRRIFRRKTEHETRYEEFWALRDVDFQVRRGECVGIVGRNGAGKSTLLKVLSRITEPTVGGFRCRGRIASLLEVGTGFHPELTGRENIYLNGAILGMRREEIRRKFDEIVAFSEIDNFLDTPVKYYSSGMYTRLAFAVAAHLEPEILVVDEVLAVGDAAFQKKCLGKMSEVAHGGRTVLFVSHNMQAVTTLCNSAVLLRKGRVVRTGSAAEVVSAYLSEGEHTADTSWRGRDGDDNLALRSVEIVGGTPDGTFLTHEPVKVRIVFELNRAILGVVFAVELFNQFGTRLVYSCYDDTAPPPAPELPAGLHAWELTVPADTLAAGNYRFHFDLGIHNVRRVSTDASNLQLRMENLSGLGRRFQSHTDCIRPNWTWRPVTNDLNT